MARSLQFMAAWAIRVQGLRKEYPGRDGAVLAVNGLDLEIPVGESFGLLGPNGAGKTTTVEILEGLNKPTAGDVEILGYRWETHEREIRERIGVTLQETRFPDKQTVREMVELFASFYRHGLAGGDGAGSRGVGKQVECVCRAAFRWPAATARRRGRAGGRSRIALPR